MPDAGPLRPCVTCPTPPGLAPAASKVNGWHPVAPYVDEILELLKERSYSTECVRMQASVVFIRRDCCDGLGVPRPPRPEARACLLVGVGQVPYLAHRCCGDTRDIPNSEQMFKRKQTRTRSTQSTSYSDRVRMAKVQAPPLTVFRESCMSCSKDFARWSVGDRVL
jgi:hypothetical protein